MNWIVILMLLTTSPALAAEAPSDFAFGMPIQTEAVAALYELEIPAALYRGVGRADLGDLRVFNGKNEVVPHALRPRLAIVEQRGSTLSLPVFPLHSDSGAKLEDLQVRIEKRTDGTLVDIRAGASSSAQAPALRGYLVDASAAKEPIGALQLDWQSAGENFVGKVRVDGSDDLTAWRTVVENATLARLSFGGHHVRRSRVALGAARFRYYRMTWPAGQKSLAGLSLTAEPTPMVVAAERQWQRSTGKAEDKGGDYSFDLGGRFPFDRLRVELPEKNTLAQVQLLSRAKSNDEWRMVTAALVYRLSEGDAELTSPDIIVNGDGEPHWLLRVDPQGGGIGSGVPSIQIGWVPQKLVFAARGEGPFQLAYGSAQVRPASFAIERLVPGYKSDAEFKIQPAKLGEPVTLAGAARLRAAWDYKKIGLWATLILGVAALGWMATGLARQVGKKSPRASDHEKQD